MTEVSVKGRVGPDTLADGTEAPVRMGKTAELVFTELHGRFYEQTVRGAVFSGGMGLTSISNATYTVGGIGATTTPVAGVYNPSTSSVNVVVLQAVLSVVMTALQATGPGGFVWATSIANPAISTGAVPFNRRTLAASGSQAKDMTNVALTGITNNVAVRGASALGGGSAYNIALLGTAAGFLTEQVAAVENLDGGIIVPPGGILTLLATTTPVAHSAASMLLWEEVPV
jgi:hypothetical protein